MNAASRCFGCRFLVRVHRARLRVLIHMSCTRLKFDALICQDHRNNSLNEVMLCKIRRPNHSAQDSRLSTAVLNTLVQCRGANRTEQFQSLGCEDLLSNDFPIDRSVQPVSFMAGGLREADKVLKRFVQFRLPNYAKQRNQPDIDGTGQLSPYLHFGCIGPHTVALAVRQAHAPAEDAKAFLEEVIAKRVGDELRAL